MVSFGRLAKQKKMPAAWSRPASPERGRGSFLAPPRFAAERSGVGFASHSFASTKPGLLCLTKMMYDSMGGEANEKKVLSGRWSVASKKGSTDHRPLTTDHFFPLTSPAD